MLSRETQGGEGEQSQLFISSPRWKPSGVAGGQDSDEDSDFLP